MTFIRFPFSQTSRLKIEDEAKDLDRRVTHLKAKETQQVQQELNSAKVQIDTVVQEFENRLNCQC